jgi:glycine oxidase
MGLWQAFELARRGHDVVLREAMEETASGASSRFAGAMLAPNCESEIAEPVVQKLGSRSVELWRRTYPGVVSRGSLVVAAARDQGELTRFSRMTKGHYRVNAQEIKALEPDLAGRFASGLFYAEEAHLSPRPALGFLIGELRRLGAELRFGDAVADPTWLAGAAGDVVIDCRGMSARDDLAQLRGVRGEMAVLRAPCVKLSRSIRLLHPRFPLYVVPWGDGEYMLGATVIESEDTGPVTLRSGLDLLGSGCVVSPAFREAEIIELATCVRPAFPDNVPRITLRGRRIFVNGAYRHGYLMAPALAELVANYLETGATYPGIFTRAT